MSRNSFELLYRAHSLSREQMSKDASRLFSDIVAASKKVGREIKVVRPKFLPPNTFEAERRVWVRAAPDTRQIELRVTSEDGSTTSRHISVVHACALADEIVRKSTNVMVRDFQSHRVRLAPEAAPLMLQFEKALLEELISPVETSLLLGELKRRLSDPGTGLMPQFETRRPIHVRTNRVRSRVEIRIAGAGSARRVPISIPHARSLLEELVRSLEAARSPDVMPESTSPNGP